MHIRRVGSEIRTSAGFIRKSRIGVRFFGDSVVFQVARKAVRDFIRKVLGYIRRVARDIRTSVRFI